MKNSWSKVALTIFSVVLTIVLVFYFTRSKSAKQHADSVNPAFAEYISSYTSGVISSGSALKLVFSKDVVDSTVVGQEASVKLFDFDPSVKGDARWLDRRTLEFKPASRLVSGQIYEVNFKLSKLLEVPKELEQFAYSFQVIPQNFELTVDNVKPYVKTELTRQKIEGSFFTSDFAESQAVEQALGASQEGKGLKISWTHAGEGKQHLFVVEDVVRKDGASTVKLSAVGRSLGITQGDEQDVEIPALNDFKITSVKVDQSGNQHVVLQFSDPLNEKQDLAGLITITDLSSLEFEIKDNEISVYPPVKQTGEKTLHLELGIKNILNYKMKKDTSVQVVFEQMKPAVRFTGKGSILPATNGLVMPFEAVNLKGVDLQIIKIFENNVLQFLQINTLDGTGDLRRVGRPILTKHIQLDNTGVTDLAKWNRYTLDLATLIQAEPGAIYQVRLSFKKDDLAYTCEESESPTAANDENGFADSEWSEGEGYDEGSNWDSYEDYYYGGGYDWEQRENPCHISYYAGHKNIKRNVIASDLGILAKRGGDGKTIVFVNDLITTKPASGIHLDMYDYQLQVIGSATTDSDGKAVLIGKEAPFALIAKNGSQRGYLKLQDGESLSLSSFDVGGEQIRKGLKGFIYGERGVWRPGDSLYLSFLLEDKLKLLPENHPVVFELQNPQGQIASRQVQSLSENGFYKFGTVTSPDAPTGNWMVRAKVGGTEFTQQVKIEMVKPNRLKIDLNFGVDKLVAGTSSISGKLKVNWLQGSPGKNLKTQFEVTLTKAETKFDHYDGYIFDDPSRNFKTETRPVFEGITDANGEATVNADLKTTDAAPGLMNAVFRGKVFEDGGNFSVDRFSIPYYPYSSFTGIRMPLGDKARSMLLTDTTQRVEIATVDANGNPVSRSKIEITLYKVQWRWWWENSGDNGANYMTGEYSKLVNTSEISTVNGKGTWDFKIKHDEWGRYFVRAYDPVSGHSTGKIFYIDWPGWAGRARGGSESTTMLSFSSSKPSYAVGEKVEITFPGSDAGRALVSVENGTSVIQSFWVETKKGDNPFSFVATKEMTPNIFVNVTLIQPHAQTSNDLPIRLYGVIPIKIEDPATHLNPVLSMPDVLEPGQEVVIKISEQSKRKMTYTIAVVEEGLLDLTKFKTPDAWSRFYAREALGVKTWDLYDNVMGAFGGKVERLLAIGGDGVADDKEDDKKANRFKPVVKFFGPFTLDGGSKEHRFTMPQYIGSVKTMVVAGYEGAYGKAEKATPVRKPLMVLATLPRVLGPEETLKLPITIFTTEKNIKNIKVSIKTTGPLSLPGGATRMVVMQGSDMTVDFDLAVKGETGFAKVEVTASSGNYSATDIIEINVRNPNPPISSAVAALIESGQTWTTTVAPIGITGTNSAVLEVSNLPPVNLGQRLQYLIQYPYGCIEQTTSAVFPQLYLDQVKVLTPAEKAMTQYYVKAGIERMKLFVTHAGGFAYWPGQEDDNSWGTNYAGHFLLEAASKGYFVPNDLLKKWKKFQHSRAQSWRPTIPGKSYDTYNNELIQAYRLYTLALSGDPELGAMNRLREEPALPVVAKWMLAAAYVKAGQPEAAKKLITNLPTAVNPYHELDYSYGSNYRDEAIILETLVLLNERTKAYNLVKILSAALSSSSWMSTQEVAWCLKSVGAFAGTEQRGTLKFKYTYNGKEVAASTELPLAQVILPVEGIKNGALKIISESKGPLFARVITEGTPARGNEQDGEENISMEVIYTDAKGLIIDPAVLEQGTNFLATVKVTIPAYRSYYKNIALTQIFPSGWEINNLRMDDTQTSLNSGINTPTYQDIRDDRVYTFFDLGENQRKVFVVSLTASYAGTYYLPAVNVEAMYDHGIYSRKKGRVVEVTKPKPNP